MLIMFISQKVNLLLFCLIFSFFGCGSSEEDKVSFVITEAEIFLNASDCNSALTILKNIEYQKTNARYLQTLASAYACKSSFKETTLFTNLGNISAGGTLLGQFTKFTTASTMTSTDDIDFLNMQSAIDTLLYAGGLLTSNNPSVDSRAGIFSPDDALSISTQLFYLMFDQIGRYGFFYGCYDGLSSGDGDKGKGRAADPVCSNRCFANYTGTVSLPVGLGSNISGYIGAAPTGSCDGVSAGHTSLAATDYNSSQITILCQGVILMNNFLEVLDDISSNVSAFAGFKVVSDFFDTPKANGASASISDVMDTLSQSKCESDFGVDTAGKEKLMKYFVLFYESTFL